MTIKGQTGSGFPRSGLYPIPTRSLPRLEPEIGPQAGSDIVPIIPPQDTLINQFTTFDHEINGEFKVIAHYLDVPPNVTWDYQINGALIARGRDKLGMVGRLEVGQIGKGGDGQEKFQIVRKVRFFGNNAGGSNRDVRAWLVVIP